MRSLDGRVAAVREVPSPVRYAPPQPRCGVPRPEVSATSPHIPEQRGAGGRHNANGFTRAKRVPPGEREPGVAGIPVPSPVAYSPDKPRRYVSGKFMAPSTVPTQFAAIEARARTLPAPGDYHHPALYNTGAKLTGAVEPGGNADPVDTVPMARPAKKISLKRLTLHKRKTELATLRAHQTWCVQQSGHLCALLCVVAVRTLTLPSPQQPLPLFTLRVRMHVRLHPMFLSPTCQAS